MNTPSRRELNLLLPAFLTALTAEAADKSTALLPSACFPFDKLPVKKNEKTGSETRQVFTGATHEGYVLDLHITTLQPGQMPHAAHTHQHEEMMMIQTGTLEITISGNPSRIGPGSVTYVKSMDLHGLKNVGNTPSTYFVLAFGNQKA